MVIMHIERACVYTYVCMYNISSFGSSFKFVWELICISVKTFQVLNIYSYRT